jgi:hypothetical protein
MPRQPREAGLNCPDSAELLLTLQSFRRRFSEPPDIAASIDSANSRGENSMKIIRTPFARQIRVDRDRNPAAAKLEFHLEIRFSGSFALPRPLEFGIVNQVAEFRYELLHCKHPALGVITPPGHSKSLRDWEATAVILILLTCASSNQRFGGNRRPGQ